MSEYRYLVIDAKGAEKSGRLRADTREAAADRLAALGHYVVRIELAGQAARTGAGEAPALLSRFTVRRLSQKELSMFTRQLGTLIQVSPIEEALRTLVHQTEKPHVRAILSSVHQAVVEGRRLAEAMATQPRSFPALFRAMIAAGEMSGSLPDIMHRLSLLLERQAAIRSKVLTATAYPAILALFAIGVVIALMTLVVPRVVEQFDTVGQQLPLLTRIVIAVSGFLVGWWPLLLAILLLGCLLAAYLLQRDGPRRAFDAALLRIPFFGRLLRDLHAARMARTLATLVGSRLPIVEGLALTARTVHNRVLRDATVRIVEDIRGGGSLSVALRRAGVFPPLLVYLTASGEAAGRLDEMLERAAEYLEQEFDIFTSTALAMLEPVIIILMGAVVAVIILAILLPILQLQILTGL